MKKNLIIAGIWFLLAVAQQAYECWDAATGVFLMRCVGSAMGVVMAVILPYLIYRGIKSMLPQRKAA